jgi:hypothetical protein
MTLANIRENGVRAAAATCEACRREADVKIDPLPETVTVPKAGQRLWCSNCGGNRPVAADGALARVGHGARTRKGVWAIAPNPASLLSGSTSKPSAARSLKRAAWDA